MAGRRLLRQTSLLVLVMLVTVLMSAAATPKAGHVAEADGPSSGSSRALINFGFGGVLQALIDALNTTGNFSFLNLNV